MPDWTEQQQDAIDRRSGGLLISAAAGSGKTAVLSHRAVKYVKNGGSLSRLLVVTFTRLAASEMKQRISAVISKEYAASPTEHLKREKVAVYGAKISTIDSYFSALLRQNFQAVGLSPDFSMITDSEYRDIMEDCLERQLEEYYTTYKNDFAQLLKLFGGEQDSSAVSTAVKMIYNCLCSVPFPDRWLEYQLEKHRTQDYYIRVACRMQAEVVSVFRSVYEELLPALPFKETDIAVVEDEYSFICELENIFLAGEWDIACDRITNFTMVKSPNCRGNCAVSQKYKYYRNLFKNDFLEQPIFLMNSREAHLDGEKMYPQMKAFFAFVSEYCENIKAEFRKRNRFSFDFIAQSVLSLLISEYDYDTGKYVTTSLAKEISDSYDEVMIDEYQDVNDIQDLLFHAISDGGKKLFAVGDVKQSIYRFRQANPRNFIRSSEEMDVIYLNRNFRSRKSVLDFINFIFEGLFSKECCEMVYSDDEKLYAGLSGEGNEDDVEYLFATSPDKLDKAYVQAVAVAKRITELISSGYTIYDKETNSTRPLRLGDIAVLARSIKDIAPIYETVFRGAGINLSTSASVSFWNSVEVNTVLAFLNVIDNPYDDLAFFAVMFSDIYAFGAEKIARIKLADRDASLYEACRKYGEQTGDPDCIRILSDLKKYHLLSKNLLPDRLIRRIYADTSYPEKVSCLTNGRLRYENLMRLYDYAGTWSSNNGGSLYDFLVSAEIAGKNPKERTDSPAHDPNSVRLMTIHSSKGLEFPVCFVTQIDNRLNLKDTKGSMLFCDEKHGVSTRIRDDDMIYQTTTLPMEVMKLAEVKNFIAEELRILYVALTRAREKLVVVSSSAPTEDKLETYAVCGGENVVPAVRTLFAKTLTHEDMMMLRLVHHPCGDVLRTEFSHSLPSESSFKVRHISVSPTAAETEEERVEKIPLSSQEVATRISSAGDESILSHIPAKFAVTELVKGTYSDEGGRRLPEEQLSVKRPRFISRDGLSSAQRGTAMHKYCRYCDISADTEREIARLTDAGYLTPEEGASLNRYGINAFRNGIVGKLIASADEVRREDEFVVRLPASVYHKDVGDDVTVLVQGAMDLLVKKGDEYILVDYKTDRADERELLDRYLKQLDIYRLAATKAYGLPVTKVYIWSFHMSKEIDCTPYLLSK